MKRRFKGLALRVLLILVSFPAFYVLIFLLPQGRHLILNIIAVLASFMGSYELFAMVQKKKNLFNLPLVPVLAATINIVVILEVMEYLPTGSMTMWLVFIFAAVLIIELFVCIKEGLERFIDKVSYSMLIILYPALFISFIIRISALDNSSLLFLIFFSLVFSNDILAYVAGKLLGHASRLNLSVSPRKSLVGFITGFFATLGITILFYYLLPELFHVDFAVIVVFGIACGLLVILGDLVESALKRSAEIKDSGEIIPGRGGLLDSIDSLLLIAPLFLYFFTRVTG